MNKNYLTAVIVFLFFYTSGYPQTPPYYHYATNDGLGSSTVYDAMQDRNGFMWFATLNGLSRFDGKTFKTYRTEDGLNSNVITNLQEGDDGEIYIGNFEKGLNILENGKIKNYCSDVNGKKISISFLLKDKHKIYTYHRLSPVNVFMDKSSDNPSPYTLTSYPPGIFRFARSTDNQIIALTVRGLYTLENDLFKKMHIEGIPDTNIYCMSPGRDRFIVGSNGMLFIVKKNRVVKTYETNFYDDNEISQVLIDSHDNTWFSIRSKGCFFIPHGSDKIINIGNKLDLGNAQICDIFEDRENNIWLSTYGKGVYCLNNLYIRNYSEKDGLDNNDVHAIVKESSGKLIIGTFNGINIFNKDKFDYIKDESGKILTGDVYGIKNFNDTIYISWAHGWDIYKNILYQNIRAVLLNTRSFAKLSDGFFGFGSWVNVISVEKGINRMKKNYNPVTILGDSLYSNRVNEILEDSQKNIWIGTALGLCKLNRLPGKSALEGLKKTYFYDNPVLSSRINFIHQDKKKNIWFAAQKGVASYNLETNKVTNYTKLGGYDLSGATSVVSDNKGRIWIGTMSGLYLYDGSFVKYLNNKTGLSSDEVLTLFFDPAENSLYAGTSNGFSEIDIELLDLYHYAPPDLKILSLKAGDSVYTKYDNLVFEPEQNNVYLDFAGINYSSPGTVRYKYKLNDQWIETGFNFINFSSLQHGTYTLQVMARTQNSKWGKPYLLTFTLLPSFTQTIWYRLGMIFLLIAAAVSLVTWRLKLKTKKVSEQLDLTERINELKHQALSAMMNPHFIFNSLNSVQYLVNSGKYEEANEYIAMMAKLMRKNLDTAGSGFILLSEEINRLRLYLELEKLRFRENFAYEIIIEKDIITDSIMIPNMIIQPFVENSLWHGIINSGKHGKLTVSFSFEDIQLNSSVSRTLTIRVTDNGIGILEARKNKKEDHISKGIHIIEERLKLLSAKMELPKPIMFEDLSIRDNSSRGTEVIISLPLPLYKNVIPAKNIQSEPADKLFKDTGN